MYAVVDGIVNYSGTPAIWPSPSVNCNGESSEEHENRDVVNFLYNFYFLFRQY